MAETIDHDFEAPQDLLDAERDAFLAIAPQTIEFEGRTVQIKGADGKITDAGRLVLMLHMMGQIDQIRNGQSSDHWDYWNGRMDDLKARVLAEISFSDEDAVKRFLLEYGYKENEIRIGQNLGLRDDDWMICVMRDYQLALNGLFRKNPDNGGFKMVDGTNGYLEHANKAMKVFSRIFKKAAELQAATSMNLNRKQDSDGTVFLEFTFTFQRPVLPHRRMDQVMHVIDPKKGSDPQFLIALVREQVIESVESPIVRQGKGVKEEMPPIWDGDGKSFSVIFRYGEDLPSISFS